MEAIQMGTKIKSIGINRANVADNAKGRAVLLDPNPRVKHVAYDNTIKRAVEVTQDDVIKYGFNPRTNYYFLIARMNTDMEGTIVGDKIIVEYVQLAQSVYDEYIESLEENGKGNSILLKKVAKGDYSYVTVKPSQQNLPQGVVEAVRAMRKDAAMLETMWQLVDKATSISVADYEKMLQAANGVAPVQQIQADPRKELQHHKPQARIATASNFEGDDEFSEGKVQDVSHEEVEKDPFEDNGFGDADDDLPF